MLDHSLAGFRLVEKRYGLVADLPITIELTLPYCLTLVFHKGVQVRHEVFQGDNPNLSINLAALGKIVKHREDIPGGKTIYTYTDGSWDSFGN